MISSLMSGLQIAVGAFQENKRGNNNLDALRRQAAAARTPSKPFRTTSVGTTTLTSVSALAVVNRLALLILGSTPAAPDSSQLVSMLSRERPAYGPSRHKIDGRSRFTLADAVPRMRSQNSS
jgi:hypothetical protein